ncbi:MAG: hypothetical protein J6T92_03945, partial [Ottowia sp.]|nr:hypothetical protein [Ottowia sp.]
MDMDGDMREREKKGWVGCEHTKTARGSSHGKVHGEIMRESGAARRRAYGQKKRRVARKLQRVYVCRRLYKPAM